ncbi:YegP family protein [Advenella sp. RU8]|uniref:YegP family protein n=1 Tax=Advenella sp. RU8 TaxID=3399575 RepID=UPI003AAA2902
MSASFELKKSSNGQFHFSLKAENGSTILSSEQYTTLAAAKNGLASVQKNSTEDGHYVSETSSNGKFFFNLKASNGQIIGTSPMFADEATRHYAIAECKTAATAKVIDNTNT